MSEYNKKNVKSLLQYILACAGQNDDYYSRSLSRIHLIKYVYMADLAYAKHNKGATFTGLPWRFYKFGPWCEEVFREIEPALEEIGAEKITTQHPKYEDDRIEWRISDDELCDKLFDELNLIVTGTVQRMVGKYGADTSGLLHHSYNTAPMRRAAPNEYLDFSIVVPPEQNIEEETKSPNIQNDQLTDRRKKKRREQILAFKERVRQKEKPEKRKITPRPPRYDDVFYRGLAWLDRLAGEPITSVKGEMIISPEVWKSTFRFDPERTDDDIS